MSSSPFVILNFGQVQVQIQVKPIDAAGLSAHLDQETRRIKQLLSQRGRLAAEKAVVIVDGSVALMPPAEARKLQADWLKTNKDLLQLVTHKLGFVLPNPILRGFVSAVFYLVPLPIPSETLGSLDEAVAWAIREARSINGVVDEELLTLGTAAIERRRAQLVTSKLARGVSR